ncbi:hypothetical protein [Jatrophihabitans sp. GAS493]|uniref:hypothetical protein n=1 Tax=Jatrophihabitans sp. GAS493 TaxID=1907575 RepID=UPI0012FE0E36|nr:hypothetical protein [Jatrophihabitans sp. GAS493]
MSVAETMAELRRRVDVVLEAMERDLADEWNLAVLSVDSVRQMELAAEVESALPVLPGESSTPIDFGGGRRLLDVLYRCLTRWDDDLRGGSGDRGGSDEL